MSLLLPVPRAALMTAILLPALLLSDQVFAADLAPSYVGADLGLVSDNYGQAHASGRVHGGYTVGSTSLFGKEDVHAIELMAYSLSARSGPYSYGPYGVVRDHARGTGLALNWASALKVSDSWAVTSRVGIDYTHAKAYHPDGSSSWDSVGWLAGVGASYALSPDWKLTADVTYMPFKVSRYTKVSNATLNVGVVRAF